jgi:hypothetical protein
MKQVTHNPLIIDRIRAICGVAFILISLILVSTTLVAVAQAPKADEPSKQQPTTNSDDKKAQSDAPEKAAPEQPPQPAVPSETQPLKEGEPTQHVQPAPAAPSVATDKASTKPEPPVARPEPKPVSPAPPVSVQSATPQEQKPARTEGLELPVEAQATHGEISFCANGRRPVDDKPSQRPPLRVNGDLGFLASSQSGKTSAWLSPLLDGSYRVMDTVAVSADWGFAFLDGPSIEGSDNTAFRMGNPFLAVHSVRQHGCTELKIGIGATIPLATLPKAEDAGDRIVAFRTYRGAMAMRGMMDWWLWVPDSMTIALPVSWETAASTQWIFSGEIALASTVYLKHLASTVYSDEKSVQFIPTDTKLQALLMIPISVKGGYRIDPFIFGMRLQLVWVANGGEVQLSAIPSTRLDLGIGYVEVNFNLNLNKPFGFGSDEGMLWGLHLTGGIEY